MTEVTLASLAMDFDVRSAVPATQQTDQLRASTRALEEQAKATTAAMRDQAVSQGLSGTAAGKAVQAMAPLVGVWGQARDALGRFTAADGSFRMSQDLTAKMVLQNANAATAYARQQEQAAKAVAKAEADAARSREADMNATATLLIRNAKLQDDLRLKEEQAAKTTASYAARVDNLRASLDPFAAVQLRLSQNTRLLDEALAHGAITARQYEDALSQVTRAATSDLLAIDNLNKAHGTLNGSSRTVSYAMLNMSRQASDLGVGFFAAATSSKPLQMVFMTIVQQAPQVIDIFADLKTQGIGVKTALAEMATAARGLLVTFGPWIAGLAAVGAGVWAVVAATEAHEKRIKAVYKAIDEQNKKLSEAAPWLIKTADNAYLAAEGQKNFEAYLRKTNGTLDAHIQKLREAAVQGYKLQLQDAQTKQKQAQTEFERISTANGRGSSPMGFTTNVGGFTTVSAAPTRQAIERTDDYKKALAEVKKATENVTNSQTLLNEALKVKPDDYGVFAGQASQAEKLAGAIDSLLPKEKQISDIRQQRAIVEQALAKGQISSAQAARALAAADREIANVNRDPAAERALKAAERKDRAEAKKELAEITKAYEGPLKAAEDFADALAKEVSVMGMSTEEQKRREIAMQAAAAPTAALAEQITALGRAWEEQNRVGKEWTDIQRKIGAAANDNVKTFSELNIRIPSAMENAAYEMDEAARSARELRFDIEDIGRAIAENDWATGFAGLLKVLAQIDIALGKNATSLQKVQALAGVGMGIGSAVGGTAGAGISGAASGALAGAAFAGSKLGTLIAPGLGTLAGAGIGALLGGIGSIFGSSKAKKRARQQAAAQAAAEEAQRQQQIADYTSQFEIDTLRASGNEGAAVAMERAAELAALAKLSPALVELKQKYYDAADAAKAAADAAEKAAAVDAKRTSIQDEIDKLTLSSSELLAKSRAKERAEAVALDPTLGDLIDKLFGLQDAATVAADATAKAAADQEAWAKAFNDDINRQIKNEEEQAAKAAAAQEAYTNQMTAFANAADTAAHALDDTIKSLTEFADSLKSELGLGTSGGSLGAARTAFNNAVATGDYGNIASLGKAYADAAKSGAGSQSEYLRIVAQIRQASLNSATSARSDAYQSSLIQLLQGALFQGVSTGDFSGIDEVRRLQAAGLPGFANGGSFTFGGNPGVDQNTLSLNGQAIANVSYGETAWIGRGGPSNDNSETAALRAEIAGLRADLNAALAKIADSTKTTARILTNVTPNGDSLQTESAA